LRGEVIFSAKLATDKSQRDAVRGIAEFGQAKCGKIEALLT
jgi:hypothetical protein